MAFQNHDKVAPYITERDSEVLAYLTDVRSEVLTGDDRGFKLSYHFAENPFFTDKVGRTGIPVARAMGLSLILHVGVGACLYALVQTFPYKRCWQHEPRRHGAYPPSRCASLRRF